MPSSNSGGWPYPLPTEPVRDGANAIKSLADANSMRLKNMTVWGAYMVGAFDSNSLWYASAWTSYGVQWDSVPAITAVAGQSGVGGDAGVLIWVYRPHNSATGMVLGANYVKDGRGFQGSIDLYVHAIGQGRYINL